MITRKDILMGRDVAYPLTPELEKNLEKLLAAINKLAAVYWPNFKVSSGYRPAAINSKVPGAALKSKHLYCLAVDLHDADSAIDSFCIRHPEVLEAVGLWQEHPDSTPGWCHLQCVPPKSGNRVFKP